MIINTPTKKGPATDEGKIRAMAVMNKVPIFTTITAAGAAARAIKAIQSGGWSVKPLQGVFPDESEMNEPASRQRGRAMLETFGPARYAKAVDHRHDDLASGFAAAAEEHFSALKTSETSWRRGHSSALSRFRHDVHHHFRRDRPVGGFSGGVRGGEWASG